MPIDLNNSLKCMSHWAFGSQLLNNVLGSAFFVAVVVAILMVVIVMCIYPAKSGTPFSVVAKMFVYMLFGSLFIIFLHDGVIRHTIEEKSEERNNEEFMRNTTSVGRETDPSYAAMYTKISPVMQQRAPVTTGGNVQTQVLVEDPGLPEIKADRTRRNPYQI